ncbi:MAG TPA: L,D-transpeptidase family protein [Frankiaceae bacterium]|nr:L,D-transpeptidase family protein [Frankiaceae bacterium]
MEVRFSSRAAATLAVPAMLVALAGCGGTAAGYASDPPPPSYPAVTSHKAQSADDYGVQTPSGSTPVQQATAGAPPPSAPATAPKATAAFDGLKPGDSGAQVRALEEKLQSMHFWVGSADGNYGLTTTQAVMAVQKAAGLTRDGVMGTETRKALARGVSVSAKSSSGRYVEIDRSRQLVMLVQNGDVQTILNTSTGSGQRYSSEGHTSTANTPAGRFTISRQVDALDKGPLGDLWRPKYFNGGIALHGAPSIPAYPASHGCARISNPAIDWIWDTNQAPIGTNVWVY